MLLENKVAIVSGVGPGLGREVALAFAREGADLVLGARGRSKVEALAEEVRGLGRRAVAVEADVTRADDCAALVGAAVSELGGLDVLVNNAFRGPSFRLFEEEGVEAWREVFEVNLFGALELSRAAIAPMRRRGGGSVVMIGSMSMRIIEKGHGGYAASKGALVTATQVLARELGGGGIRVNAVVPGYIWGPAVEAYFRSLAAERGVAPEDVYREVASETSLGRLATSAEIADAVLFFASGLSRAVTGQALDVNAGHCFA